MLMKIPNDHSEMQDISLKIGRYTLPFGKVVVDSPKSELTLDNDELNELVKYISDNYVPVNMGAGEYVNVTDGNAVLIKNFKELLEKQTDTANYFSKTEYFLIMYLLLQHQ